jgi:1-aminocyclopropane-1-carboxylate deaminase
LIPYLLPPIQRIFPEISQETGVSLALLREDLNHPQVSGNKWWKLKYNLEEAMRLNHRQLLTFGGSYSNHIYATAAAASEVGLRSIGVIRGEEGLPLNPVLSFAGRRGMKLKYISRAQYREKMDDEFLKSLNQEFGNFFVIPEGGTNDLAVKGCAEWGDSLLTQTFDYLCLPVGTGGTMAGIVAGLKGRGKVLGFSVLKGGEFLNETISGLLRNADSEYSNWEIETNYHFGGYARTNNELNGFINSFRKENGITLEPIYTGKMMYGIYDRIAKNKFEKGSSVLALHTGGVLRF